MGTSDGQVIGATKIVDHGSDASRWNLAILSEGYKDTELPQFANDAQSFVTTLSTTPPFDGLWPGINVYRIDVTSTESGADDPVGCGGSGAAPATYFDATFCTNGTDRLLSVNQTTVS